MPNLPFQIFRFGLAKGLAERKPDHKAVETGSVATPDNIG